VGHVENPRVQEGVGAHAPTDSCQVRSFCRRGTYHILPDTVLIFSVFTPPDFFSFLQARDGPEPKSDDGTPFEFAPTAPVVLFGKDAPPLAKVILHGASRQGKSLVVRVGKRKRSAAAAPQVKPKKMTTRQDRQATPPTPSESKRSIEEQVCLHLALLQHCCIAIDIPSVGQHREHSW
jgi:hypothetical protein